MTSSAAKKSRTAQERAEKTKAGAKKDVAQRGTIQYRLDEETMLRLMKVADSKKTPVGVLARMWMVERLSLEEGN
jgi:uncharacterized protein YfaQ (DUF2300 family)